MNKRAAVGLLSGLFIAFLGHSSGSMVAAQQPGGRSLSVSPALVLANIPPGGSQSYTITVKSSDALDVDVAAAGMGQTPDGAFQVLTAAADTSLFTARQYIQVSPTSFHLNAGESRDLAVTISVPDHPGDGGRYALLQVRGVPPSAGGSNANVGVGSSIGASVVVTLEGTAQQIAGKITDVQVGKLQPREPLNVTARVQNTGNYHYGGPPRHMFTSASLLDPKGNTLVVANTPPTSSSLIPTYSRDFPLQLNPVTKLTAGTYKLNVEADLDDGTVLDKTSRDITLTESDVLAAETGGGQNWTLFGGTGVGGFLLLLLLFLWARRRLKRRRQLTVVP